MNKKILYPALVRVLGAGCGISDRCQRNRNRCKTLPAERSQGTVRPRSQSELIPEVSGGVIRISPSMVSGGAFHAGDELTRLMSWRERQLASQQQLDNARRTAPIADANRIEAKANLTQACRDLARTQLKAPFDGLVRSEHADLGQFVTRGQSIGAIYATGFVEVRLPISADQLAYLGLPIATRGMIPQALQPLVTSH
jgi:hypothetical protein